MSPIPFGKRCFDVLTASAGLLVLAPLFAVIGLCIKLESEGPVFFRQERMGRAFRPFLIYKFRTMVADAPLKGGPLTAAEDSRITRVGRILRRTKIDELPQLINVLCGEMSLVGPRPEVPCFVNLFREDYEQILSVPPGITDPASLKYRDESAALGLSADPEREYVTRILPDKIALAKQYLGRSSLLFDLALILKTVERILTGRLSTPGGRALRKEEPGSRPGRVTRT